MAAIAVYADYNAFRDLLTLTTDTQYHVIGNYLANVEECVKASVQLRF